MKNTYKAKPRDWFTVSFWCAFGAYCGWTTARRLDYCIDRAISGRTRRKETNHAEN